MTYYPSTKKEWYLNPFSELESLQKEMNKLFNHSLSGSDFADNSLWGGQRVPSIDLYESKDKIIVKADVPGIDKKDIDVTIQDNVLTIKGEKKHSKETKEEDYIRTERFTGSFHRSIALPSSVDREKVQARYENGVLELNLPKKEEAKAKQITIDVE